MKEPKYTITTREETNSCGVSYGWQWEISAGDRDPFTCCGIDVYFRTSRGAEQAACNHARKHHYRIVK